LNYLGFDTKLISFSDLEENFSEEVESNILIERVALVSIKMIGKVKYSGKIHYIKSSELSNQIKEIMCQFVPDEKSRIFGQCAKCERKFHEKERRNRIFNLINRSKAEGKCLECRRRLNINSNVNFLN
jgi:hypothetical protein